MFQGAQDTFIVGFLLFGAISSICVVLSTILKLCRRDPLQSKNTQKVTQSSQTESVEQQFQYTQTEESLQNKHEMTHLYATKTRRSKSDNIEQYVQHFETYSNEDECIQYDATKYNTRRRHSEQIHPYNTPIARRFSGIAKYYRKHSNIQNVNEWKEMEDSVDSKSDSVSPMSIIYYPNRTRLSVSPRSQHNDDIRTEHRHFAAKTTIFEEIMMNTTVLDGIRLGRLHDVIHECTANDISDFFPIIAAIICKIPYGMKNEQDRLLQSIRERAITNAGLRQSIQFFMISNQDNELVRQIWRHSAFMIALDSSRDIDVSIDDHDIIPSTHTQQKLKRKRKKSSGMVKHHVQHINIRRQSFTIDELNIEATGNGIDNDNDNAHAMHHLNDRRETDGHRRRYTRSYVQSFNDNVDVFRWMIECPVGSEFEADAKSQEICDPINGNQQIHRMEIKKIFQSAARPVLIDTFDINQDMIGSFILKEGDDLRQDESIMFMFHIMNAIWEEHRLEYNCVPIRALTYVLKPMGLDFGAIELVQDCVPLRDIATLKDEFETNEHLLNNLIASSVGSYVATYVLGVGDRHFDNILIRSDGTLFHIDFGYILGNKVSMDTADIAITYDLYTIIVSQNEELWQQFIDMCVDAFMILRKHVNELIQFAQITFTFVEAPTAIDEFFNEIFGTHLMDKEVEITLRNLIEQAPFDWNTKIKNKVHTWATASWYPRTVDLSVIKQLSLVSQHIILSDESDHEIDEIDFQ